MLAASTGRLMTTGLPEEVFPKSCPLTLDQMATEIVSAHDIFPHIRIVMGMVIGLGVTRLLSGVARIVQHPGQYRLYPVHLAWVASCC